MAIARAGLTFYREYLKGTFLKYPRTAALVTADGTITIAEYTESQRGEGKYFIFLVNDMDLSSPGILVFRFLEGIRDGGSLVSRIRQLSSSSA